MSINDKIEQLEKAFENLKIIIEAYEKEKDKIGIQLFKDLNL